MERPEFAEIYERAAGLVAVEADDRPDPAERITLSAEGMELVTFLRWVSDETGVSVVAAEKLDRADVTVDVKDVTVGELLGLVARRLGVEISRTGRVYFLGELRAEDRAVLVRQVVRLSGEDLTSAVSVFLSDNGRVLAQADGLVVVGDRVEVLARVNEMLDRVETASPGSWVLQAHVVAFRREQMAEFGFDVQPAASMAATFASLSGGNNNFSRVELTAALDATLRAAATDAEVSVVSEPMFLLQDGERGTISDGSRVPFTTGIIQEGDTVSENVEFIDVGFSLDCELREVGQGQASIDFDLETSDVVGFVGDIPIESGQQFQTRATVQSGGVYLLGSLERSSRSGAVEGPLSVAFEKSAVDQTLMIWLRTYRVGGLRGPAAAKAAAPQPTDRAGRQPTVEREWPDHDPDRVHVARELAERDGYAGDTQYIGFLLGRPQRPSSSISGQPTPPSLAKPSGGGPRGSGGAGRVSVPRSAVQEASE